MHRRVSLRHVGIFIIVLKFILIAYFIIQLIFFAPADTELSLSNELLFFALAGFFAQMIDGALGMAYGVSCNSLLMSFGVPPALASASIHTAEVFTTGVSGLSHLMLKNVNKKLLFGIALPGIVGSFVGAFLLSKVLDGDLIKPYISAYLLIMGLLILRKSIKGLQEAAKERHGKVSFLGLAGGFFDAIGGGGWGPIVTTNLIHRGNVPKETIGTVNTAEFFVTFISTGVFIFFLGVQSWQIVLGLIAGGVVAAPIGALLAGRLNPRLLMTLVGITIIIVSGLNIYKSLI